MHGTVCKQIRCVGGILKTSLKYQTGKLLKWANCLSSHFLLLSSFTLSQANTITAEPIPTIQTCKTA